MDADRKVVVWRKGEGRGCSRGRALVWLELGSAHVPVHSRSCWQRLSAITLGGKELNGRKEKEARRRRRRILIAAYSTHPERTRTR